MSRAKDALSGPTPGPPSLGIPLPAPLAERTRALGSAGLRGAGEFVLYWLRTAQRGHQNPALEAGLAAAAALDRPLLVYQGLSERTPFANLRQHRFILEGARDLALELAERGIAYALHVERPGQRGRVLADLARRAALLVSEDFPLAPLSTWAARLARDNPLWLVDTACVVPMRLFGRRFERAFDFRRASERLRRERLVPWSLEQTPRHAPFAGDLGFEPVDVIAADLEALCAAAEIDAAVAPVPGLRGGSRAGYARWQAFLERGLAHYAERRNDALQDGTSRLSPYLHFGMVSPLRIAVEAAQSGRRGADKFLDELLIWRELAWNFCFHTPDVDSLTALPEWARRTLAEHAADPRARLDDERLERGQSGDALWDAAQAALLLRGELHNNLRMTWGKALLGWSRDAQEALRRSIDLNHRYALDGRDPSSYGGLLWCLGQFDRPFPPERPIGGLLRARPTHEHAERLDAAALRERLRREISPARRVAVIGAGLAGLAAARVLVDHGREVVLFDKGRRAGGRCAARGRGAETVDHGAQYFTERDRRLSRWLSSWLELGLVAPWEGRLVRLSQRNGQLFREPAGATDVRYVGVPDMNALPRHLAQGLDVRLETRIQRLRGGPGEPWFLIDSEGREQGPFDALLLALPPPQAADLLSGQGPLEAEARARRMTPCWAAWLEFDERPAALAEFDGAFVETGSLAWIAANGSKPGRRGERILLHARPDWSAEHLALEPQAAGERLHAALAELLGPLPAPRARDAHRWGFAAPAGPPPADSSNRSLAPLDPARRLALAGDAYAGGRVEGALLSGFAAAGRLLALLADDGVPAPS
jgi:photolyase PhrII